MKKILPTLAVVVTGILWGVISLMLKPLNNAGMDAMQIASVKITIAAVCYTAFLLIKDPGKLKIKIKDIWMFVGSGIVSLVLFSFLYFSTIIHSQASIAVVLLYTSPIFIMILSAVFFKEKITLQKIIAVILTFAGCIFVTGIIGSGLTIAPMVLLTGVLSGLTYGLYTIFCKAAMRKYDSMTITAWTFIIAVIGIIPFAKVDKTIETISANTGLIWYCIGLGIINTVLPYFLYTWGLQRMESSKAAILVAIEPLVGSVIGMTVFHESHDAWKIVGIILILAAIVLMDVKLKKKRNGVK